MRYDARQFVARMEPTGPAFGRPDDKLKRNPGQSVPGLRCAPSGLQTGYAGNLNDGCCTMRPALLIIATFAIALCATAHRAAAQSADPAAFIAGQTKDCPGCNLAGVSFKRRNLAGANLAGANLAGASFHRAVLSGANLSGADLTGANLNKTDLIQADLSNANLANPMLFEADASRANFSRANLTEALMGSIRLLNGRL